MPYGTKLPNPAVAGGCPPGRLGYQRNLPADSAPVVEARAPGTQVLDRSFRPASSTAENYTL
jgi:hypothetical protein